MKTFEEVKFNIGELKGISSKTIEEHLKLYAGYVKNTNAILLKMEEYMDEAKLVAGAEQEHTIALSELQRRFSFEFDGMRNHEYYFKHLEGGSQPLSDGPLMSAIKDEWGTFENWFARFKQVALTRGVGWAMLYYDRNTGRLLNNWNDEQHLGHLTGLTPILCLDMWEHSFLFDYTPGEKKKYVEAFFENLNWQTCEDNFAKASQ